MFDRFKLISVLLILIFILLTLLLIIELQSESMNNMNVILLSLIIISILLVYYLNQKTEREINHIISQTHPVLQGNYNVRAYTETKGLIAQLVLYLNNLVQKLQNNNIKYQKAEKARKELLSNVSHDIRTPLTSIIGYVDALKDGVPDNEREEEEYLDIVSKKAGTLKKLVDNLFYLTKLDADEVLMDMRIYDLGEILREVLINFLPQIKSTSLELQVNIPDKKLLVLVDHLSMERIFSNIIQNAVQYGSNGNTLGINILVKHDYYEVVIWDNGQGIAPEHIPHLFDRLYKGERLRKKNNSGSGLGLTISKELIEKHQGNIKVDSVPWEKTAFIISIPKKLRKM